MCLGLNPKGRDGNKQRGNIKCHVHSDQDTKILLCEKYIVLIG